VTLISSEQMTAVGDSSNSNNNSDWVYTGSVAVEQTNTSGRSALPVVA
jgi:hypothetical protein